jgi:hypothetical protein
LTGTARAFSFGLLAPLAAAGLVLSWRRRRQLESLLVFLGGLEGTTMLFFVFGRYRAALIPGLALLAAAGLVEARARTLPPRQRTTVARSCLRMNARSVPSGRSRARELRPPCGTRVVDQFAEINRLARTGWECFPTT